MSRFIGVVHGWHVDSRGFDVHQLKARTKDQAEDEALLLAVRRDSIFDRTACVVVEIDDREHLPRKLTWRERLTGNLE